MKRFKLMVTLVLLTSVAVFLESCKDDDPDPLNLVSVTTDSGTDLQAGTASDVPLHSAFVVTFDKEIDAASATASSIGIKSEGTDVPGSITVNGAAVTLKPESGIAPGKDYKISISSELLATDGASAPQVDFSFKTFGRANVVPPQSASQLSYFSFSGDVKDEAGTHTPAAADVKDLTFTTDRFGHAGLSGNFNGSTTMVEIPDADKYMEHKNLTVSFWIKVNGTKAGNFVMGLAVTKGFNFEIANDWTSVKFVSQYADVNGLADSEDNLFSGTGVTKDNGGWQGWTFHKNIQAQGGTVGSIYFQDKWAHVVHTYDATTRLATLYINGEKVKQTNFNLWGTNDPKRTITGVKYAGNLTGGGNKLALGFIQGSQNRVVTATWGDPAYPFTYHYQGQMDDVRIFKVALTSAEVATLYTAEKP
jgi:hypothetical protein